MTSSYLERVNAGRAKFNALLPEIVKALPGEWKYNADYEGGSRVMRTSDDLTIFISAQEVSSGRGYVSPSVPQGPNGGYRSLRDWGVIGWDESPPSMSFSLDRKADAIAREIVRKVIEPYTVLYIAIKKKFHDEADAAAKSLAFAKQFAEVLGERVPNEKADAYRDFNFYSYNKIKGASSIKARVPGHGGSVMLEMSVTQENAVKIVEFLKTL